MSPDRTPKSPSERPPCRKCMVIRLFLMAVAGIAILHLLSPATLRLAAGLSALHLALLFVSTLAVAAIGKAVAEHRENRPHKAPMLNPRDQAGRAG